MLRPLVLLAVFLPFSALLAADEWKLHPDAAEKAEVPKGQVTQMPPWESKLYPGTVRDWSVYVPAQYKPDGSAAVMVFQDGHDYANPKGNWRVPTVFDNLIAEGAMPPTIAIFINPGHDMKKEKPSSPWKGSNRSLEYDSLGDRYARFLLTRFSRRWRSAGPSAITRRNARSLARARAGSALSRWLGSGPTPFARCSRRSARL